MLESCSGKNNSYSKDSFWKVEISRRWKIFDNLRTTRRIELLQLATKKDFLKNRNWSAKEPWKSWQKPVFLRRSRQQGMPASEKCWLVKGFEPAAWGIPNCGKTAYMCYRSNQQVYNMKAAWDWQFLKNETLHTSLLERIASYRWAFSTEK